MSKRLAEAVSAFVAAQEPLASGDFAAREFGDLVAALKTQEGAEIVTRDWRDILPSDAAGIDLSTRIDITAPLNESGERCPWPWDPQQLTGAPIGQYHCPYCGAMVLAGWPHLDYADLVSGVGHEHDEPEPDDL